MAEYDPERDNLTKSEREMLENRFVEDGMAGFKKKVDEMTEKWKNTKVYIALIGQSGSGKSSLINALLGLMADDEGAAETGETETTKEPTYYENPKYKNIFFVDLPGCGTENFPLDSYLEKIEFQKYDFFIFVNSNRFLTDDIKLAKKLFSRKRKFYFVRTKIGQDMDNFILSHRDHGEKVIAGRLEKIRAYCFQQIAVLEMSDTPQYLVDSYAINKYEFKHLVDQIVEDAPEKKKESLVLGLNGITMMGEKLIKEKEKYLNRRIWKKSLLSAAASAVPVIGLGESVDMYLLETESAFFRCQLGLDESTLEKLLGLLPISEDIFEIKDSIIYCTEVGILKFLKASIASNTAENIAKFAIPVIGYCAATTMSYGATVWGLKKILDSMVKSALAINELLKSTHL